MDSRIQTYRPHGRLSLCQLLQLPIGGFLAVRHDLLAAVDPFYGGCSAEIDFLGLEAAGAGVEDDPGLVQMLLSVLMSKDDRKSEAGNGTVGAGSEPLELALFGVARCSGWMEELDRIGSVEEGTCFGVALAESDKA